MAKGQLAAINELQKVLRPFKGISVDGMLNSLGVLAGAETAHEALQADIEKMKAEVVQRRSELDSVERVLVIKKQEVSDTDGRAKEHMVSATAEVQRTILAAKQQAAALVKAGEDRLAGRQDNIRVAEEQRQALEAEISEAKDRLASLLAETEKEKVRLRELFS